MKFSDFKKHCACPCQSQINLIRTPCHVSTFLKNTNIMIKATQ
uniref:Uncharacterized protein n=1 Tax=Rhizophora mucronata TaxID=61149 RepID=A0A2P2NF70_RHIMU